MRLDQFIIARGSLLLLFFGITFIQLFSFPGQFAHMRRMQGVSLLLEISLTLVVGMWLLCGQLALVAIWKIVGEMKAQRFFALRSMQLIDRLIFALKAACVFPIIIFTLVAPQADDPGFFVLLSVITLFLVALAAITTLIKDQIAKLAIK